MSSGDSSHSSGRSETPRFGAVAKTGLILVALVALLGFALADPDIGTRLGVSLVPGGSEVQSCESSEPTATPIAAPPDVPEESAEFVLDFETSDPGPYSDGDLDRDWNQPDWNNGVSEGRVTVGAAAGHGRVLRVEYPSGAFGSRDSGAQWQLAIDSTDAAYVRYLIRFVGDFDYVLGGKLPGLAGGEANTGGSVPDGTDGWSARMMWRESGCAVSYVYHPDQPGEFGEDLDWLVPFRTNEWHLVEQVVVMNTPGQHDGMVLGWIDGEPRVDHRDLRFRDESALAIDTLYFSTFFGGGSEPWAATSNEYVEFDDFVVAALTSESTQRLVES